MTTTKRTTKKKPAARFISETIQREAEEAPPVSAGDLYLSLFLFKIADETQPPQAGARVALWTEDRELHTVIKTGNPHAAIGVVSAKPARKGCVWVRPLIEACALAE